MQPIPRGPRQLAAVFLLPFLLLCLLTARPVRALDFILTEGQNLAALQATDPALYATYWAGLNRTTTEISKRFSDPVTLRFTVEIDPFSGGNGILAAAGPNGALLPYAEVRDALNARMPGILPDKVPTIRTGDSDQSVDASEVYVVSPVMKNLGIYDTPLRLEQSDGVVYFNSGNHWDVNPDDGISFGSFDFVSVAEHEFWHLTGFVSAADSVFPRGVAPGASLVVMPTVLDLYRYRNGVRDMSPVSAAPYFSMDSGVSDIDGGTLDVLFSPGTAVGAPQASHWGDIHAGWIMNSAFGTGQQSYVSFADERGLNANGWTSAPVQVNVGAPEPSTFGLMLFLCLTLRAVRKEKIARPLVGDRAEDIVLSSAAL